LIGQRFRQAHGARLIRVRHKPRYKHDVSDVDVIRRAEGYWDTSILWTIEQSSIRLSVPKTFVIA
jgi:hypothetical protein